VVIPDVVTDADIHLVHAGLMTAIEAGGDVVVRAAAPLAALCAGRLSEGYLARPVRPVRPGVLVVCGSHTAAATAQLHRLAQWARLDPVVIPTDAAFAEPAAAGRQAAAQVRAQLSARGLAILATERDRRPADATLDHGAKVMGALIEATTAVKALVGAVVSKGGITSAEVARTGFAARTAHVRGQVAPGISVWDLTDDTHPTMQVIVPGNVGDADTLVDVLHALAVDPQGQP
jgi:uncharacterized protein YgbK (DUF1537 family)